MAFLDIILGLLLLWGLYKGLRNGLLIELASILALIAGLYGAFHFSYIAGDYLAERWEWDEKYITLISFIITFIVIVVAVNLIGKLLTKVIDVVMLGLVNRIAGAFFGLIKVAVILGAFLVFFERVNSAFDFLGEETKQESVLYTPLLNIGAFVFGKVFRPAEVDDEIDDTPYFTCTPGNLSPLEYS